MKHAILLAAGEGQRLRPLTRVLPKCLVPVHGRPLLGRWLDQLAATGIEEVLVNTCYLAEMVESYLAAGTWRCRVHVVREPRLRGTGGSLVDFADYWREEGALLVHADNLTDIDLPAFLDFHRSEGAGEFLTMASFDTEVPAECGIVACDDEAVVRGFYEKVANPPGRRASAAVFALNPALADRLPASPEGVLDFSRDVVPTLVGRMKAWHHAGFHRDIGHGERYLAAQWEFPADRPVPDAAWSALLRSHGGRVGGELSAAIGELAQRAGYLPRIYADSDEAIAAEAGQDRELAIILRGRGSYSPSAQYRACGRRSIVLEVEGGADESLRQQ